MKPHDTKFKILRIYVFTNIVLMYPFVSFHRTCPSIVTEDMADSYKVEKSKLGIFSSIFFYPYAILQVFAGLLADIFDPAILIGGAQIIASIGAVICGLSNNVAIGCIGRFLVGLGCGPSYVPICKVVSYWFPLQYYASLLGLVAIVGNIGGILAQYPLASFAEKFGWRNAFYGIAGLGAFLAILVLIFCRGTPEKRGYEPVNKEVEKKQVSNIKEKLIQLKNNFLEVIKAKDFWIMCIYIFLKEGPYFDISGLWGGPFLVDVYNFSNSKKGITLLGLTFGAMLGGLIFPPIARIFKTKKWILFANSFLSILTLLYISLKGGDIQYGFLYVLLILIGMTLSGTVCINNSLLREYFHPSIAGTSIGLGNFFAFLGTAIYQMISSATIPLAGSIKKPDDPDKKIYLEKGYRNGLWIFCTISTFIATLDVLFAKDTLSSDKQTKEELEKKENECYTDSLMNKSHKLDDEPIIPNSYSIKNEEEEKESINMTEESLKFK